jgi:hypothetical protein
MADTGDGAHADDSRVQQDEFARMKAKMSAVQDEIDKHQRELLDAMQKPAGSQNSVGDAIARPADQHAFTPVQTHQSEPVRSAVIEEGDERFFSLKALQQQSGREDLSHVGYIELTSLAIKGISGIQQCRNLTICILGCNSIASVQPLMDCHHLQKIDLHQNWISVLPAPERWRQLLALRMLCLHENRIDALAHLSAPSGCPKLAIMTAFGNPTALMRDYRTTIVRALARSLLVLDDVGVSDEELGLAEPFAQKLGAGWMPFGSKLRLAAPPVLIGRPAFRQHLQLLRWQLAAACFVHAHGRPSVIIQRWVRGHRSRKRARPWMAKRLIALRRIQRFVSRWRIRRAIWALLAQGPSAAVAPAPAVEHLELPSGSDDVVGGHAGAGIDAQLAQALSVVDPFASSKDDWGERHVFVLPWELWIFQILLRIVMEHHRQPLNRRCYQAPPRARTHTSTPGRARAHSAQAHAPPHHHHQHTTGHCPRRGTARLTAAYARCRGAVGRCRHTRCIGCASRRLRV